MGKQCSLCTEAKTDVRWCFVRVLVHAGIVGGEGGYRVDLRPFEGGGGSRDLISSISRASVAKASANGITKRSG